MNLEPNIVTLDDIEPLDPHGLWRERPSGLFVPSSPRSRRPLRVADLFCGCGGFSLGMQEAGLNVVAAVEWDPWAIQTYLSNLGSAGGCAVAYLEDTDRERHQKVLRKSNLTKSSGWIGEHNPRRDGSGCRAMVMGDVTKVTGDLVRETLAAINEDSTARRIADAARTQSSGRTISHAVDAYEVAMRERDLEGTTITRARAHLDKLLSTVTNGPRALVWLTPRRAADLYAAARSGYAVDTQRNALAAGRSFGRFCVDRGWLAADPFAKVKGIGRRKRGKMQLGIDETRKLVDVCFAERSRVAAAVATSVLLGCGASEVVQRQVRDLDDGGRVLHITRGKNRYRVRSIEVPTDLRAWLLELAAKRPSTAHLFGESDLDRPNRYWIYWHCKRLCRIAKVNVVSVHGLRGTHATIAVGSLSTSHSVAAAVAAAGAALGHAPGSPVTASTYVAPGTVAAAEQRTFLRALDGGKK